MLPCAFIGAAVLYYDRARIRTTRSLDRRRRGGVLSEVERSASVPCDTSPPARDNKCRQFRLSRGRVFRQSVNSIFSSTFQLCIFASVRFVFQSPTAASVVSPSRVDDRSTEQDLRNVNDPSAGSPTETLLRLLLPLNDQVWSSSRQHRQCRDIAAHQSEDLTKSFNR